MSAGKKVLELAEIMEKIKKEFKEFRELTEKEKANMEVKQEDYHIRFTKIPTGPLGLNLTGIVIDPRGNKLPGSGTVPVAGTRGKSSDSSGNDGSVGTTAAGGTSGFVCASVGYGISGKRKLPYPSGGAATTQKKTRLLKVKVFEGLKVCMYKGCEGLLIKMQL
uniref:Uncharacterized protein n=1 Tax=Panagrolaimus superbus TaxID=310955 RepID=A0A914Z4L9_9BILA